MGEKDYVLQANLKDFSLVLLHNLKISWLTMQNSCLKTTRENRKEGRESEEIAVKQSPRLMATRSLSPADFGMGLGLKIEPV